jgi:hypothetical protein
MAMTQAQIQEELARLRELEAALRGQAATMTSADKIKALEDAQPHVKPKTKQAEALLQSGYGMTVAKAETIIKERKTDPALWPLERAEAAQAMLDAYNATTLQPSSPRAGWHRTRGV